MADDLGPDRVGPGNAKPAASARSVGGMNACAVRRWGRYESEVPSGGGNENFALGSKGSPESDTKRSFHIRLGKNAVLSAIGARRWLRGPLRSGPTTPLESIPIAIDCVSPKPFVGEWQPAQALSSSRPVIVSNHSSRPVSARRRSSGRPSRCVSVDSIRPVKPLASSVCRSSRSSARSSGEPGASAGTSAEPARTSTPATIRAARRAGIRGRPP